MKHASVLRRLNGLGGAKWDIHQRARSLAAQGRDIIELTIGEPDVLTPPELIDATCKAMRSGRTNYSNGRGEDNLRTALSEHYTDKIGAPITTDRVLCFPGTQTALFAVLMGVAEAGDEVLVGDPMYATYEGLVRATGAELVPVPLRVDNGFRIQADDIAERITPRTRALLLTTPHNPTGAVLSADDIRQIGRLARAHDFWIVSDEVYEDLVFDGHAFSSPLSLSDLADRVIVVSSISKSHAAPGFRSGWSIAPAEFTDALLPLSETMLFGNQPFIADMTEKALREGSSVAAGMRARYAARAAMLAEQIGGESQLIVHPPQAGMFAMVDISATGMNGIDYASDLLHTSGVAVMPGSSFGATVKDWVRVALTVDDDLFEAACARILAHAKGLARDVA